VDKWLIVALGKISALQKVAKEYIFGTQQCKYNIKNLKILKVANLMWH